MNIQNIPKDGIVLIKSDPGYRLIYCDYCPGLDDAPRITIYENAEKVNE